MPAHRVHVRLARRRARGVGRCRRPSSTGSSGSRHPSAVSGSLLPVRSCVQVVLVVVQVPDAITAVGALLPAGSVMVTSWVAVPDLPHTSVAVSDDRVRARAWRRCATGWPCVARRGVVSPAPRVPDHVALGVDRGGAVERAGRVRRAAGGERRRRRRVARRLDQASRCGWSRRTCPSRPSS